MIAVVVAGHGNIASEIASVAEQILHRKYKYFESVNVKIGESQEAIRSNLDKILRMAEIDGVLILADIKGSFANACAYESESKTSNIAVVTGVNLNMVLKVLEHREELDLGGLVALACEGGKSGIVDVCKLTDK